MGAYEREQARIENDQLLAELQVRNPLGSPELVKLWGALDDAVHLGLRANSADAIENWLAATEAYLAQLKAERKWPVASE